MIIDEKKFYLTKNSLAKIQKEYQELKKIRILKINSYSLDIKANDFDSSCLLEDINFLEIKIAELEKILKNVAIIAKPPKKEQVSIHLGATVVLQGEDGRISKITITGSLEANPEAGKISFCSPLGRALLGHKVNDQIAVVLSRSIIYKIIKINYR